MKRISLLIAVIIVGLSLTSHTVGQKRSMISPESVRIDEKLPTVFLALERTGIFKDADDRIEERRVWLRLRNNSRWLIKLDASGGNKSVEDAKLYYDTLDGKGNIKESRACHVCSIVGLASGKSILFSVPYEEVAEAASLRIQFSYVWEDDLGVAPAIEPRHYVYFYSKNLAENK